MSHPRQSTFRTAKMPTLTSPRHIKAREILFDKFHQLSFLQDPIEQVQFEQLGVSASCLGLEDAGNSPQYFLPATADQLDALRHTRAEIRPDITTDGWYTRSAPFCQSEIISHAIHDQVRNPVCIGNVEPCMLDFTQ